MWASTEYVLLLFVHVWFAPDINIDMRLEQNLIGCCNYGHMANYVVRFAHARHIGIKRKYESPITRARFPDDSMVFFFFIKHSFFL